MEHKAKKVVIITEKSITDGVTKTGTALILGEKNGFHKHHASPKLSMSLPIYLYIDFHRINSTMCPVKLSVAFYRFI